MKTFRFSLKGLLFAIAVIAFACVALLNATALWACIAFTGTVLVLLTATVGILFRVDESRASYIGASLFGWTYVLFSFGPAFSESTKPLLVSTPILELLYAHVEREIELHIGPGGAFLDLPEEAEIIQQPRSPYAYRFPIAKQFHTVGHSLFGLLFVTAGGLVARFFYRTKDRSIDKTT